MLSFSFTFLLCFSMNLSSRLSCLSRCKFACQSKPADSIAFSTVTCTIHCPPNRTEKSCPQLSYSPDFAVTDLRYEQLMQGWLHFYWNITWRSSDSRTSGNDVLFATIVHESEFGSVFENRPVMLENDPHFIYAKTHRCSETHIHIFPVIGEHLGNFSELTVGKPGRPPWIDLSIRDIKMQHFGSDWNFVVFFSYKVPPGWKGFIDQVEVGQIWNQSLCSDKLVFSTFNQFDGSFIGTTSARNCKQNVYISGYTVCQERYTHSRPKDPLLVDIRCKDFPQCACNKTHDCRLSFSLSELSRGEDGCSKTGNFTVSWEPSVDYLVDRNSVSQGCQTKFYSLYFISRSPDAPHDPVRVLFHGLRKASEKSSIELKDVPAKEVILLLGCQIFETYLLHGKSESQHKEVVEKELQRYNQGIGMFQSLPETVSCAEKASEPRLFEPKYLLFALIIVVVGVIVPSVVLWQRRQEKLRLRNFKSMEAEMRFNAGLHRSVSSGTDWFEIDPWEVEILHDQVLGSGAFGKVYKGKVLARLSLSKKIQPESILTEDYMGKTLVAVKICHEDADSVTKEHFLQEINLIKQLHGHKTLVNILHCITKVEPFCLVLEFCENGDLLHFLRHTVREYIANKSVSDFEMDSDGPDGGKVLTYKNVLYLGFQVADGMQFMTEKGFIHRDLAARNILITKSIAKVKIGDFGLCRHVDDEAYVSRGGKLPIKWMALESLVSGQFTAATDVWSFAILIYEVLTLGGSPYPELTLEDQDLRKTMINFLSKGNRMKRAKNCTQSLCDLISEMWDSDPEKRPSFSHLKTEFRKMIDELVGNDPGEYGDYYLTAFGPVDDSSAVTANLDETKINDIVG